MANILGVTNPVPGQEATNVNRNVPIDVKDPRIQNAPDLERVTRGDGRADRQNADNAANAAKLRYDSNFGTFLQKLANYPQLSEAFSELILKYGTVVSSGMEAGLASEIAELMQMLKMNKGEMVDFLKQQLSNNNRFGGALFATLREALAENKSDALSKDIANFLRHYTAFTGTEHSASNLTRNMERLTKAIPATYGNQLTDMAAQLEKLLEKNDRAGALKLLQGTIMPFLANYTSKSHDMGFSRSLITLLALDIAHLEGGSEEALLQSFHMLSSHAALRSKLGGVTDDALLRLIRGSGFMQSTAQDDFANQLLDTARHAMSGSGGSELQAMFKEIASAFTINESVFMPVNHTILPVDYDGTFLFSELWVDPDAENSGKNGNGDDDSPVARFLIKMDIEDVGLFDVVVACQDEKAELLVNCPTEITMHAKYIKDHLAMIFRDNGLDPQSVHIGTSDVPLTVTNVFPKIYNQEVGVDVQA
ncbi:MAG: hypothetical protein R3Y07_01545 [Eubacteriales bacterium]